MQHARVLSAAAGNSMKTFGDFADIILSRLISLSRNANRVDIVFDSYVDNSIKAGERLRRMKKDPINMTISTYLTDLPKDIDAFWASNYNKTQLQKFFKLYFLEHKNRFSRATVYLSGVIGEEALKVQGNEVTEEVSLRSSLEEADERIFLHVNHAINTTGDENILIASSDTDVFVCAVYYFHKVFQSNGLKQLWILFGSGQTARYVPLHELSEALDKQVIETLPAIHSLTGCDTTSKFGTKHSALTQAKDCAYIIQEFGREELTDNMIEKAEEYLTRVLSKGFKEMDDLRTSKYHQMKKLDFTKLPPASWIVYLHIKRAYLQAARWYNLLEEQNSLHLDPSLYGYEECESGWMPKIIEQNLPDDFPHPCTCKTCGFQNKCACRLSSISCSRFCKCGLSDKCKNNL